MLPLAISSANWAERSVSLPMARHSAKLVAGLIAGKADRLAFLQELVP